MKLFLFGELNGENVKKICPDASVLQKRTLKGYQAHCTRSGRGFLKKGEGEVDGFLVDCSSADVWNLDQWKEVLYLHREEMEDGLFSYFSIYEQDDRSIAFACEKALDEFAQKEQSVKQTSLKMADVHLLIPGYCVKKPICEQNAFLGQMLQNAISRVNADEFNSSFFKECARFALGEIKIIARDGFEQNAVLTLMLHKETRLCVVDVFVPAIVASAHELLEGYCGDFIKFKYQGKEVSIGELCDSIGVKQCGARRSMVFSYELIEEESLLNLLVNEEKPMGKIMGSHFKNIVSTNIAQYDTAQVYVSSVTMVEMTDRVENDLFARIGSQAVEIFFVEMLLLQDAAVSKMYERVQREIEIEREHPLRKNGGKIIAELIDEAAYATNFTDYQQFYYPTVRVSADKVAKAFGIDEITKRYDQNKEILEQMIKDHNAEIARKENRIKNGLLIIITLLSGLSAIYEIFNSFTDSRFLHIAPYVALAMIVVGVLLYFIVLRCIRSRIIKNFKKKRKQRRDEDLEWYSD